MLAMVLCVCGGDLFVDDRYKRIGQWKEMNDGGGIEVKEMMWSCPFTAYLHNAQFHQKLQYERRNINHPNMPCDF